MDDEPKASVKRSDEVKDSVEAYHGVVMAQVLGSATVSSMSPLQSGGGKYLTQPSRSVGRCPSGSRVGACGHRFLGRRPGLEPTPLT